MKNITKYTIVLLAGSTIFTAAAKNSKADEWNKNVDKQLADKAAGVAADKMIVTTRTDIGRQEIDQRGDAIVAKANKAFQNGEFMAASKLYIEAKKEFQKFNSAIFAKKTAFCDRYIALCYNEQALVDMKEADKLAESNDYDGAVKLCKEAIKFCPERAEQLEARINFYEKRKVAFEFENSTSIDTLKPDHRNQEYQIQVLLEQGRKLAARNEYAKAIRKFNDVLLIDPYNDDANQNLLACYNRVKVLGDNRRYNTHYRMISEAAWKFSSPILPETIDDSVRQNLLGDAGRKKVEAPVSQLEKKLKSIRIPALNLGDVTVAEAITTLRELSRTLDPERQGINIVYLEPKQANPAATANAGATETQTVDGAEQPQQQPADGENAAADASAPYLQPITLNLSNRTLYEALERICEKAKLSAPRIEHDIVIISHKEIPSVDLETRLFRAEIPDYRDPVSLQRTFEKELDIPFPKGSELYYHPNICTLVVKNTRLNLDRLGKALEKHFTSSVSTPMVQIRLKVIEVSQNDLNELAFNWYYGVNTVKTANSKSEIDRLTSKTTQIGQNNQLLRYYYDAQSGTPNPTADKTLGFSWTNNDGTFFDVSMYALNQADSADTLYSPQVTTLVGVPARVSMLTQRTFPEDWELIDYETSSQGNTQILSVTPFPNLDNVQNLGMDFKITPHLITNGTGEEGKDRRLIQIEANFLSNPIKTFSSWYRYDARYVEAGSEGSIDGEYYMMPIFDERQFKTLVTLYDGETVLLTGMAIDTNEVVHDKIPILGDIPFIGRFFQSRYTKATKSNLLVFATCRLVKPDGTPLYPNSIRPHGEFDFGRNY
ncbi:MAG: hypothetical protein IJW08_03700 [Lentisphaeria bacterium]|nr:hypothetical protein [Lentisphaeria bacterium]MBR7118924.1 hypothetical protein [Lentisphaeria bacterium]